VSSLNFHRYDVITYIYVRIGLILIDNVVYKGLLFDYFLLNGHTILWNIDVNVNKQKIMSS